MKILQYLYELKLSLLYIIILILFVFILNFYYFNEIIYILLKPLFNSFKLNNKYNNFYLIFTNLTDIFFIYIKIFFLISFYISIPLTFLNTKKFISNGLYCFEIKIFQIFFYIFSVFICINNFLIYFVFIPLIYGFFISFEVISSSALFNLYFEGKFNDYLNFIFNLFFTINVLLNIPIVIIFFKYLGIFSLNFLVQYRKLFYFFFLIVISILTPPDILSLILLIFILFLIYEFSLFLLFFTHFAFF